MYEAKQHKERVSRSIGGGRDGVRQRVKMDTSIIQRAKYVTTHGIGPLGFIKGEITVKEEEKQISLSGYLYGSQDNGIYSGKGSDKINVKGSLIYTVNENKFIINTISSTPKRTGCGAILMYHLCLIAENTPNALICTELSALEEGTPEFYLNMNLIPANDWIQSQNRILQDEINDNRVRGKQEIEKRKLNLYYSSKLSGDVNNVKTAALTSFQRHWEQK